MADFRTEADDILVCVGVSGTGCEGTAVFGGIAGICFAGGAIYGLWAMHIADRKPKTFSPQWIAATAKYRAAQAQDPISSQ